MTRADTIYFIVTHTGQAVIESFCRHVGNETTQAVFIELVQVLHDKNAFLRLRTRGREQKQTLVVQELFQPLVTGAVVSILNTAEYSISLECTSMPLL